MVVGGGFLVCPAASAHPRDLAKMARLFQSPSFSLTRLPRHLGRWVQQLLAALPEDTPRTTEEELF